MNSRVVIEPARSADAGVRRVLEYMASDHTDAEWAAKFGLPVREIRASCKRLKVACKPVLRD